MTYLYLEGFDLIINLKNMDKLIWLSSALILLPNDEMLWLTKIIQLIKITRILTICKNLI